MNTDNKNIFQILLIVLFIVPVFTVLMLVTSTLILTGEALVAVGRLFILSSIKIEKIMDK